MYCIVQFFDRGNIDGFDTNLAMEPSVKIFPSGIANTGDLTPSNFSMKYIHQLFTPSKITICILNDCSIRVY